MSRTSMLKSSACVAGLLAGLLTGCANAPDKRDSDRLAAYTAAAGAPVSSFRVFNPFWSWESLSDSQLAVYTRPNQAWLIDVDGCQGLTFANAIGVTSNMHVVTKGFDRVLMHGIGVNHLPCIITQIRPVDVAHLKAVQQAQRKIDEQPREGDQSSAQPSGQGVPPEGAQRLP